MAFVDVDKGCAVMVRDFVLVAPEEEALGYLRVRVKSYSPYNFYNV